MLKWLAQALLFTLFAGFVGYFSIAPAYQHLRPDQALVRLSISHAGQLVGNCRNRSQAELDKLSRNMRALQECPRQRSPIMVDLEVDGQRLYHEVLQPSGLSHDGASSVYRRFALPAGEHKLSVKLNDSARTSGYDYQRSETVQLRAAQVLVIDFNQQQGGVIIK